MSDHIEHACEYCGSFLHSGDNCPDNDETDACPVCDKVDCEGHVLREELPGDVETFRDRLAMAAVTCAPYSDAQLVAKWAYRVADAMMEARKR